MTKIHAKETARQLRRAGYSYNMIAPKVGVSKGTLSVWLADVPYSANKETVARVGRARAASGEAKSRLKRESLKLARVVATEDIGTLSKRDLFMLGLGLFIGEGAKSLHQTCFVNANPQVIECIIRWFTISLEVPRECIRIRLHIYPDTDDRASLEYWAKVLNISLSQFLRSSIDRRENKLSIKTGKLPHGTAHMSINGLGNKHLGVFLARRIMACMDIVLENKAGLV